MTTKEILCPLFARVILKRIKTEKVGSLIIPDSAQKKYSPTKGEIISCGGSCDDSVKDAIGKTVYFAKYAGDWIQIGNEEIFICQDEDILGVVDHMEVKDDTAN